nr:translation initiation factor IF-2 N-terminal domain-containing protein [Gemmatimonadales bacterium]
MVKTRVHDLAAEFGVPPEQLLGMLKDMSIFVRSHLSALENDQVSAIRVRWEREKRKSAEEPAAKKGRRKAVKAEPPPAPVEARPAKRRRTAAEVAVAEAQAESERAAELAALELERPIVHEVEETVPTQSLEERARALFRDLPAAPAEPYEESAPTEQAASARPVDAAPAPSRRVTPTEPTRAPFIPPRIQRPPASPR